MKIYLESYGCTLNKAETGLYANRLLSDGNTLTESEREADLRIIGTCVVIRHTEEKMIQRISELASSGRVKVLGCLPAVSAGTLTDENIELLPGKEFRDFHKGTLDEVVIREPAIFEGIPINQGCTGSCNFCISRVARGKLLSRPVEKIVGQVRLQLERGIREVRISSLDTAAYGKDTGTRLPDLISAISSVKGDFRLRVGMMEPKNTAEILAPLLKAYSARKVFRFMHLPVQSGDDRILEAMNREYTVSDFANIVKLYRGTYRDSVLSTDIIVGYPDDDRESVERSIQLLEETEPEIVNITRFSPRPFTPDFEKKPPQSNDVKRWSQAITATHRKITREKMEKEVGKTRNIMVTEKGKNSTVVGRDDAYRPVVIPGNLPVYSRVECEIVEASGAYLIGRQI